MKWIIGGIIIWVISKWMTRKPKPVAVEEERNPPEFEFISIPIRRPPSLSAEASTDFDLDEL